jgi:putative sterol carrier protein
MVAADLRNDAERSLDQLFEWCCAGARARPPGRSGVFRFVVETPTGTRTRYVTITDEGSSVVPVAPYPPNSTVTLSQEDLTLLALGELRGSLAFAADRLRVEGDVFLAMTWIDQLRRGPR